MKCNFYLKSLRKIALISVYRRFNFPFQVPYRWTFDITYKCNSRCLTCRIWDFYNHYPEGVLEEIRLDEFKKTLDKIRGDVLWLTFGGGEPTLREDLPEFVESASSICPNLGLISIPTNGLEPTLIEKRIKRSIDCCGGRELFVTVSVDGLAKKNEEIRGVEHSFKKAILTLEKLKKLEFERENFHVGVQTTISRFNICEIERLFYFFSDRNIPVFFTFAVNAEVYRNRGVDVSPKSNAKFFEILDFIDCNTKIVDFKSLLSKLYLKNARRFFTQGRSVVILPCYASYASLTVTSFMDVRVCDPYPSIIGNLRESDYSIPDILKSEKCKEIRKKVKDNNCPGCWISCDAYPTILQNFPFVM